MSFSVSPKTGPDKVSIFGAKTENQISARDKAIAALMGSAQKPQETPVANPSQVAPEELSAIQPSKLTAEQGENHSSEEASPAAETSAPEKAPSEVTKTEEDQPLSPQYALLARKEKALRAKQQAQDASMKAKEEALAAKEAAIKAKELEYQQKYIPKDSLKTDLPNILAELGLSSEQITELVMNAPKQADVASQQKMSALEAEVKALREAVDGSRKSYEDSQKQSYDQALNQIKSDVTRLVTNDEAFELIKETGSVGEVVRLIETHFKEAGELLTNEEAATMVENELLERSLRIAKAKKIQDRLSKPAAPAASKPQDSKEANNKPVLKTLTNNVGTSRPLSSRERAVLAFEGKLK